MKFRIFVCITIIPNLLIGDYAKRPDVQVIGFADNKFIFIYPSSINMLRYESNSGMLMHDHVNSSRLYHGRVLPSFQTVHSPELIQDKEIENISCQK